MRVQSSNKIGTERIGALPPATNKELKGGVMRVSFPAMQGVIGQRTYYACLMKLSAIPKMFTFRDWAEFTPEDREQRILNKNRVPGISQLKISQSLYRDSIVFVSSVRPYIASVLYNFPEDQTKEFARCLFIFVTGEAIDWFECCPCPIRTRDPARRMDFIAVNPGVQLNRNLVIVFSS